MVFRQNRMDGPIRSVQTGSFTFEGLNNYADIPSNWDYAIVSQEQVSDSHIPTICVRLNTRAFQNIEISGASNLFGYTPIMYELPGYSGTFSSLFHIDENYEAGSAEPNDFETARYSELYKLSTRVYDGLTLIYPELVSTDSWGTLDHHVRQTEFCEILYLNNGNCFGHGVKIEPLVEQGSNMKVKMSHTIFNQFKGVYSDRWFSAGQNQWNPNVGGMLSGTSLLTSSPWNATQWSASPLNGAAFKIPFYQSAEITLPNTEFVWFGGCYIVQFEYNGTRYMGWAGVQRNAEGVITAASLYGIGSEFWTSEADDDYFFDPENTVSPGKNPGYKKNTYLPGISPIPSATNNPFLHAAGGEYPVSGCRCGWKTYVFSGPTYDKFVAEVFNPKLTTLDKAISANWINGMTATPTESIVSTYALPIKNAYFDLGGENTAYVRCGSFNTTITEHDRVLNDRIISIVLHSDSFTRKGRFPDFTETSVEIFIPFIGTVPLSPQDLFFSIDPATKYILYLSYIIDAITGNFSVCLTNSAFGALPGEEGERIIYQGTSNMSCPIPIGSASSPWERLTAGISTGLFSGLQVVATGGTGVAALTTAASSGMRQYMQEKSYSRFGGAPDFVSGAYSPYVRFERPKKPQMTFSGTAGFLSAATGTVERTNDPNEGVLAAVGFNSYRSVDLSGIYHATSGEKAEIEAILKSGIWIKTGGDS